MILPPQSIFSTSRSQYPSTSATRPSLFASLNFARGVTVEECSGHCTGSAHALDCPAFPKAKEQAQAQLQAQAQATPAPTPPHSWTHFGPDPLPLPPKRSSLTAFASAHAFPLSLFPTFCPRPRCRFLLLLVLLSSSSDHYLYPHYSSPSFVLEQSLAVLLLDCTRSTVQSSFQGQLRSPTTSDSAEVAQSSSHPIFRRVASRRFLRTTTRTARRTCCNSNRLYRATHTRQARIIRAFSALHATLSTELAPSV